MHSFVYRLVERLTADGPRLSRNRHFHTFVTPEGKQALRIARHLRSVATDIAAARRAPHFARESGRVRVEIAMAGGVRTAWLDADEFEILRRMPVVRAALGDEA
ncbi:hypothetical protein [Vulgatibacter sp.]|uniref:hypothetical protein n=1 Tax=Vulgatibacter sp. TaxID=1971226 RepID=UPI00356A9066